MFSYEIDEFLRSRDWNVSKSDYLYVTDRELSPQICRVTYTPFGEYFTMWTNDGFCWKFCIKEN